MMRVNVQPDLFAWARERARLDSAALAARFPRLAEWERGDAKPTLRQLQDYAKATHAPVGYFFMPAPPEEALPIPDFRTVGNRVIARPSADLLDTVYACQDRQAWYRDDAMMIGQRPLPFVGSVTREMPPLAAAERIRKALGFSVYARRDCRTWAEALRMFIAQAELIGVLVMVSGVVMSNNRRPLDPQEFRGLALIDPLAPLVFINGADSKSAQMFTLAHELAHLWLGQSALSDASVKSATGNATEIWCNQVAAELLVPLDVLQGLREAEESLDETLKRLTRYFKVSSLVVLRRMLDAGWIDRETYFHAYRAELARIEGLDAKPGGGGDFYRTTTSRVGRRFARALVESTLEGRTLYRDAFRMLGIARTATFNELGRSLGLPT